MGLRLMLKEKNNSKHLVKTEFNFSENLWKRIRNGNLQKIVTTYVVSALPCVGVCIFFIIICPPLNNNQSCQHRAKGWMVRYCRCHYCASPRPPTPSPSHALPCPTVGSVPFPRSLPLLTQPVRADNLPPRARVRSNISACLKAVSRCHCCQNLLMGNVGSL